MRSGTILVGASVCAAAYLFVGCVGELNKIDPAGTIGDASVPIEADLRQPSNEMGGGGVHFYPDIQKDLETLGCTAAGGCHGGSQPPFFKKAPATTADKDGNYQNFVDDSNPTNPAMSTIIQKAQGKPTHVGGALLMMSDPIYQRWIDWMSGGELR